MNFLLGLKKLPNYVIIGFSKSNDDDVFTNYGFIDGWIIEQDENGNTLKTKTYGGSENEMISLFEVMS